MSAVKHIPFLSHLLKIKLTQRLISALPSEILRAIWEIALNIKLGNIPLTSEQTVYFSRRKPIVRKLASRSGTLAKKKALLTPTLLQALLTPAIAYLNNGTENEAGS